MVHFGKKMCGTTVLLMLLSLPVSKVFSHCQIPCGIYDDEMRFTQLAEQINTIEKSMKQIVELSKQTPQNLNQIVRWINNKDQHADQLSHIVTYYFMAQRIKPVDEKDAKAYADYIKKLVLSHKMLVYSMKAKQTTDLSNVEKLRMALVEFHRIYSGVTKKK